jgi:hypothetical protein
MAFSTHSVASRLRAYWSTFSFTPFEVTLPNWTMIATYLTIISQYVEAYRGEVEVAVHALGRADDNAVFRSSHAENVGAQVFRFGRW